MLLSLVVLYEANGNSLFPEAPPAHHKPVLADDAARRPADAALTAARAVLLRVGVLKVRHVGGA